jgi:hypothetical protein
VIEQLVDQALDLSPEDRASFLDRTCSGDQALRLEIERLLGGITAANDFLEVPASLYASVLIARTDDRDPLVEGNRLGGYAIGRRIGQGGMATVYLARDEKHQRTVAIKVVHPELARTVGPDRFLREIRSSQRAIQPSINPGLLACHHACFVGRVPPAARTGTSTFQSTRRYASLETLPTPWITLTGKAWFTATSSQRIFYCGMIKPSWLISG